MTTNFRTIAAAVLVACLGATGCSAGLDYEAGPVFARLQTDAGAILLELDHDAAPAHVENFVHLGATGFYGGTIFHRVIPGFMIQGGDPNSRDDDPSNDGQGGPAWADVLTEQEREVVDEAVALLEARGYAGLPERAALKAEFNDGVHVRGSLSMARSRHPDSAGSQFFICVADAPHLDGQYTWFGRTVSGLDVIDAIVGASRDARDYPDEPVHVVGFEIFQDPDLMSEDERAAWDELVAAAAAAGAGTSDEGASE